MKLDARDLCIAANLLRRSTASPLPPWRRLAIGVLLVWTLIGPRTVDAQLGDGRAVPRQVYFYAFQPFNRGEYRDSLKGFRSAAASGFNTGAGRWVDSICYFTMAGECFYHLGDLSSALEQYDAALQLAVIHGENRWLKYLQLPPALGPLTTNVRISWGPTTRNSVPAVIPDTILSMRGTSLDAALRQGGPVVAQELYPVRAVEIVRCMALALRRRRQILGPVAPQLPLTQQIIKRLSARDVPANHWMQTLVNVPLAIAKATAGDPDEALNLLQQSLVVSGRYDHPLTALALLEIGELQLQKNDLDQAQRSFFEASFPAAYYAQADALEEALTGAAKVHSLRHQPGIFTPLAAAAEWCRVEDLDRAAAALWLAAADQSTINNDLRGTSQWLAQARSAMGRSDLRGADLGVELLYQTAFWEFSGGDSTTGYRALADAHRLNTKHSPRLFQLGLVNRLYSSNELSPRLAEAFFERLLREPTAQDWQLDRFDVMLFEATPHLPLMQRWLDIALQRGASGDLDSLVLASEATRRYKFYSRLPLNGRLLALRWVLEAPQVLLDDDTNKQRQQLLSQNPDLAGLSREVAQLKTQLGQLPVATEGSDEGKSYERIARELMQASDAEEQIVQRLALRPDPAQRMFPPLLSLDEIRNRLQEGQAILAFVASGNDMHAMLLTHDKRYKTWPVQAANQLRSTLASLMREIGNYDQKQVLPADRLLNEDWKPMAASFYKAVAEGLPAETLSELRELVIVPDGFLWYLPFEMLQVDVGGQQKALIDVVPIRYAPTIGLAVQDQRPKQASGPRVVVHGRLFSRENSDVLAGAADQLKNQATQGVILRKRLPIATRYVSSVWQLLVVLDDIEGADKNALGWSPAQIDQGKPGGAIADWLALPWGAPDVVVLPGFQTAAEKGMRGRTDGDELLLTTCALMAAGTRTIVLSRWRTAGRSGMELLREFLQELPTQSAASAWQRSLLLSRSSELDPSLEPRLKDARPGEIPMGDHPFFWAGYLMIGAW